MLPPLKRKALLALKKAQSSIEKIIMQVETDGYCVPIMQQNLAVLGLLKSAQQTILENHLKTCFKKTMAGKDEQKKTAVIAETLTVTKWNGKS